MQGILYMPQNLQTGSSPPYRQLDETMAMDMTTSSTTAPLSASSSTSTAITKDSSTANQSNRSDSGIFSSTTNTTCPEEPMSSGRTSNASASDIDNRSDCSTPPSDKRYVCPICDATLTSQHQFTLHIRSHNNSGNGNGANGGATGDETNGFTCKICNKVLSSGSSLDRHVLVHTGERPFTCKHCGDTFTTNGNMHRHMRTHKVNYESDGGGTATDTSNGSATKRIEFNNNKYANNNNNKKRKLDRSTTEEEDDDDDDEDSDSNCKRIKREELLDEDRADNDGDAYKCPICKRDDFTSSVHLEIHLEDNHPDYPSRCCHECNQVFESAKQLSYHKKSVHVEENGVREGARGSVIGFKTLNYIDFSSNKFPHIARIECERNLHKASTGPQFVCDKCSRAFPCANSLDIHKRDCIAVAAATSDGASLDLSKSSRRTETEMRRADFFAHLDLQNNAIKEEIDRDERTPTPNDNAKDLADIPSIISMTSNSGSFLQHLHMRSSNDASSQHSFDQSDAGGKTEKEEEESQDQFAQEFRRMKMRGEFPCRLCTAIFPNLRALKGHNRQHLNGTSNGMYRCNMCPHSSVDKAALIRHMRTHNGDRPYECALCNYAFTTKANCERHLRNRHSKSTREEVKKSIIYHPSEDPTNEELTKLVSRDEKKISNADVSDYSPEKGRSSTPKTSLPPPSNLVQDEQLPVLPMSKSFANLNDIIHNENIKSFKEKFAQNDHLTPYNNTLQGLFTPKLSNTSTPRKIVPKIQVKDIDTLKHLPEQNPPKANSYNDDSMDMVLDLSKKRTESVADDDNDNDDTQNEDDDDDDAPQDLTKKTPEIPSPAVVNELLAQQFLKNMPKLDPATFYQYAFLRGIPSLANWPPYPINPFLFPGPILAPDAQDFKERMQRLQQGGELITDNFDRMKPFQANHPPNLMGSFKATEPEINYPKTDDLKPLSLNVDANNYPDAIAKLQSPIAQNNNKPELMASPNSVKMVIKNGVLMPKQKQRRYRTERPFSCEHCSARFTLRSNMERHIKQQHPQYWSQRQRSNVGTPGRKSHSNVVAATYKNNFELNVPSYESLKVPDVEEKQTEQPISDKLKYAILAQHLRAQTNLAMARKDEDDEEEVGGGCGGGVVGAAGGGSLVIDEKGEDKNGTECDSYKAFASNLTSEFVERGKFYDYRPKAIVKRSNPNANNNNSKNDETQDLVPVSRLLDNASQQQFAEYFHRDGDEQDNDGISEEDEEGLVASGSTSEANSGTDENKSESENPNPVVVKKKSAYSLAPNRINCPYCERKFPWSSSLRRHILTHTGQKPFKCSQCPLLFTTKSNCDRHLLRKHANAAAAIVGTETANSNCNATNTAISSNSSGTPTCLTRNVPERPYKCNSCPSSTFSTYSNLKKHMNCKHTTSAESQGYEGSSEDEKVTPTKTMDWDAQISANNNNNNNNNNKIGDGHMSNSDLPFKCHLCEGSFVDRQDCLDHIQEKHVAEYELLIAKNALDLNATTPDDSNNPDDDDQNEIRGKFPDYSNRKVICAFCMRRFWSAEDLRRHMRTHTGERPFSCDICRRRFTLKHSMLRHRKKHDLNKFETDNGQSDEEGATNPSPPASYERTKNENNNNNNNVKENKTDDSDCNEGGDLISNLLGLRDSSIIEKVLTASADDAAKLLGMKNGHE